ESARRPVSLDLPLLAVPGVTPTPAQAKSIEAVRVALEAGEFATFLLHGVTGSGKTEVYLRAIEAAVASGRRALYLVPEIGLTPLLARRMRSRFGEVLALLHSGLSDGERYDEWRRIRAGLPPVERVDMRSEFKEVGRESVLSRRLLAALQERLRRGEQSLVLLNRRGFSTFVLCRACGEQIHCRHCSIPTTLHLRQRRL